MIRKLFIIALAAMALTSCSTISNTAYTQGVDTKISNMTVADLKVDSIKASRTVNWNWSLFGSGSISDKKKNAEGELLIEKDADVLVEPQYVVTKRGIFRGGSLTVTGYPATYYNFRPMTQADAEMIATANGNYTPGVPVVVESTAAFSPVHKNRGNSGASLFASNEEPSCGMFIDVVGGPMVDTNDYYQVGMNLGLMFGQYWSSWGYYVKGSVITASYNGGDDESKTTGTFTFGAIKTLSKHNNLFVGIGVGGYLTESEDYDYDYGYYRPEAHFAIPVELGWQWHSGHINALVGVTGVMPAGSGNKNYLINPFVGVGYSF